MVHCHCFCDNECLGDRHCCRCRRLPRPGNIPVILVRAVGHPPQRVVVGVFQNHPLHSPRVICLLTPRENRRIRRAVDICSPHCIRCAHRIRRGRNNEISESPAAKQMQGDQAQYTTLLYGAPSIGPVQPTTSLPVTNAFLTWNTADSPTRPPGHCERWHCEWPNVGTRSWMHSTTYHWPT